MVVGEGEQVKGNEQEQEREGEEKGREIVE